MRKMWLWCSLVCAPALMCQPGIFLSKRPLLLTANTLTVDLNDVQATKEWVVSVDTDNEKPPTVALGSGNFEPTATKGPRMVKKMGNLPPGQYDILPSSVILKMKGSPHEAILVHAVVPSGTQVKCMVNGKVISDSSVVSSLLIRSGVIINEKTSFSKAVLKLGITPHPPAPDLFLLNDGTYVASPDNVRAHLVKSPFAATATYTTDCNCTRRASVRVTVNEIGQVVNVIGGAGDPELTAKLIPQVVTWVFKPFLNKDGKPARIVTVIPFIGGRDGSIKTLL